MSAALYVVWALVLIQSILLAVLQRRIRGVERHLRNPSTLRPPVVPENTGLVGQKLATDSLRQHQEHLPITNYGTIAYLFITPACPTCKKLLKEMEETAPAFDRIRATLVVGSPNDAVARSFEGVANKLGMALASAPELPTLGVSFVPFLVITNVEGVILRASGVGSLALVRAEVAAAVTRTAV